LCEEREAVEEGEERGIEGGVDGGEGGFDGADVGVCFVIEAEGLKGNF